jgi:aspartyl aminopeptidase
MPPKPSRPAIPSQAATRDLMRFIADGPTAAHAVATAAQRLAQAGFRRLEEKDAWSLRPGDRFCVVRGHTALVAGRIGVEPICDAGFRIAAAHCDAPGLRLKPQALYANHGYVQLGVEVYGGPLLASWTDRDLTLAGKLLVRQPGAPPLVRLVRSDRALCRIPQLAIHLNRDINKEGLKLDSQKHLPPILGLGDEQTLAARPLLKLFAEQAGVAVKDVVGLDLEVVDVQPPAIGGLSNELLFAPRIDNLAGSHAVLEALLRAGASAGAGVGATCIAAVFDGEEIGSQLPGGAGSFFLDAVLERVCNAGTPSREAWHRARARSRFVSVDGAHAVHPNYADMHDPHHRPGLNRGPVIKTNAAQRYATVVQTAHWFEHCAERARVPVQHYVHRTDLPCGTTIGPMIAARLGLPAVDVGNPMLAMHSIRETGGVLDQEWMIRALTQHFVQAAEGRPRGAKLAKQRGKRRASSVKRARRVSANRARTLGARRG